MTAATMIKQQFLTQVETYLRHGQHAKIVNACDHYLAATSPAQPSPAVLQCKVTALLAQSKYKEALTVLESLGGNATTATTSTSTATGGFPQRLLLSRIYALYKCNQMPEALQALERAKAVLSSPADQRRLQYLEAQLAYRMGRYRESLQLYRVLLDAVQEDPVAYEELYTNYVAVESALLLSSAASSSDILTGEQHAPPTSTPTATTGQPTFELLYNQACVRLGRMDYAGALELLERSEQLCRATLEADGYSADEIDEEAASILLQKGFVLQNLGRVDEAKHVYRASLASKVITELAITSVAANNLVFLNPKDAADQVGFTSIAKRRELPNKLLDFQLAKLNGNLQVLVASKKKTADLEKAALANPNDETTLLLLAAAKWKQPETRVEVVGMLKSLYQKSKSIRTLLTLVQVLVKEGKYEEALQALEPLAQPSARAPIMGIVTLVAWLWKQVGKVDRGTQYLRQVIASVASKSPSTQYHHHLQMILGFYLIECQLAKEAVPIFEALVKADPTNKSALAGLVMASAAVDPNLAQQYSKHLSALTSTGSSGSASSKTFGADLEQLSSFFGVHVARGGKAGVAGAAKKKRKSRKRKPRLPKNFDPEVKPDPERWIPKRMRASELKRRRKGKGRHDAVAKGPQGAVSTADESTSAPATVTTPAATTAAAAAAAAAANASKKKKKKSKW